MQHTQMQCRVSKIEVAFDEHTAVLYMKDGDCCDMTGCIRFFEAIDPRIAQITTISGAALDTCYRRIGGRWEAYTR